MTRTLKVLNFSRFLGNGFIINVVFMLFQYLFIKY